jgi:hypothetical protein
MTNTHNATPVDESKLNAFIGQMLLDLGGAHPASPWCYGRCARIVQNP